MSSVNTIIGNKKYSKLNNNIHYKNKNHVPVLVMDNFIKNLVKSGSKEEVILTVVKVYSEVVFNVANQFKEEQIPSTKRENERQFIQKLHHELPKISCLWNMLTRLRTSKVEDQIKFVFDYYDIKLDWFQELMNVVSGSIYKAFGTALDDSLTKNQSQEDRLATMCKNAKNASDAIWFLANMRTVGHLVFGVVVSSKYEYIDFKNRFVQMSNNSDFSTFVDYIENYNIDRQDFDFVEAAITTVEDANEEYEISGINKKIDIDIFKKVVDKIMEYFGLQFKHLLTPISTPTLTPTLTPTPTPTLTPTPTPTPTLTPTLTPDVLVKFDVNVPEAEVILRQAWVLHTILEESATMYHSFTGGYF